MTFYEKISKEFEDYKKELNEQGKNKTNIDIAKIVEDNYYKYFIYTEIIESVGLSIEDFDLQEENENVNLLPLIYDDFIDYENGDIYTLRELIDTYINDYCVV